MTTARLLPADEWYKLAEIEPFATSGPPDPLHWVVPVVEADGAIVASCGIFDTVHWDGFHVAEQYRKHPVVFRQLLELAITTLQENGIPGVHITVPDDQPDLSAMVEAFGFVRAPGVLYLLAVPPRK